MNIQWPTGLGAIIALFVAFFAVLGLIGVYDRPWLVFALILALAIARLT